MFNLPNVAVVHAYVRSINSRPDGNWAASNLMIIKAPPFWSIPPVADLLIGSGIELEEGNDYDLIVTFNEYFQIIDVIPEDKRRILNAA